MPDGKRRAAGGTTDGNRIAWEQPKPMAGRAKCHSARPREHAMLMTMPTMPTRTIGRVPNRSGQRRVTTRVIIAVRQ